jgi:Cu+-exporting ATPase
MYSLIVVGVFSAWLYSLFIVISSHNGNFLLSNHVNFESALVIIGLVNLGSLLEEKAKNAAMGAIKGLSALIPATTIMVIDGEEKEIASNLLRTGYIIRIKPGMKLPADGEIISGDGYLEEAMLTGEPLPIHKKVGDKVFGGTINTSGAFEFSVLQVGGKTLLGDIIAMVKSAQMAKPPLARLADKIARVFVPTVMLLALFSGLVWYIVAPENNFYYALTVFMTVLIIACPCSVGLAIPVSLTVGIGRAAKSGIIIRDPSALGNADKIDTIILDKTGTLTVGKPSVVSYICSTDVDNDYSLQILKALEANSGHPLAHAILNYRTEISSAGNLNLAEYKTISGKGISGVINGIKYFAGSLEFIRQYVTEINDDNLIEQNRHTNIYLANNDGIIARVDVSDELKPDAKEAITALSKQVNEIILLTGDNQNNAHAIAKEAGITKVVANCLPQDKLAFIKVAQDQGKKILFVGDGINDAPSLMQADLGIAVAGGTDIAASSAAICLTGSSLFGISAALKIAKAINQNMRQNLFGSFVYNSLAILIAMGVFYPFGHHLLNPMLASIAMSLSSVTVIVNALRLRAIHL